MKEKLKQTENKRIQQIQYNEKRRIQYKLKKIKKEKLKQTENKRIQQKKYNENRKLNKKLIQIKKITKKWDKLRIIYLSNLINKY